MTVLMNKCSGCEHYDGFYKDNVQCSIGVKTTIDKGCSKFTPDITANCRECYFNESGTRAYDITCSKHGHINGQREYCPDYAERWEDGISTAASGSKENANSGWIFWVIVIIGAIWLFSR